LRHPCAPGLRPRRHPVRLRGVRESAAEAVPGAVCILRRRGHPGPGVGGDG
jgi:hypothetical protein